MSDRDTFYEMLREAGCEGVHSHDLRRRGVTGNPSQRSRELVARGIEVSKLSEPVEGRPGRRFWLTEYAPLLAVPVHPDRIGGDATDSAAGVASGADTARTPRPDEAGAPPVHRRRSPAGAPTSLAPVGSVRRMVILRDYTRPESGWMEVPESEALAEWPERRAA